MFTKVRFALMSTQIFSRTDLITDSERFYNSILELLEDPDEKDKVDQLIGWWNRYVLSCVFDIEIDETTDRSFLYIRKMNGCRPKIVFWREFARNELRKLLQLLMKLNSCYCRPAHDYRCS